MKKEWLRLIVVSAIFLLIRFFPMLFCKTMFWGDNYSLMVPGKIYLAENLKNGILPLWNPEIFSGLPLINDINQSVLYFTTGIFYLFPTATALNLSVLIHIVFILLGTYLLIKYLIKDNNAALLGALLMALSTQVSGSINNLSTIQSVTWIPWIIYWGLKLHDGKKYLLIYGIFVLMHFLAGYPQHVIYAIAFSVLLSAFYQWRKIKFWDWFKTWAITAILVLLISAVAWLPFLEMLLDSTRMSQSAAQSQTGSLKLFSMIKAVFPYFFDKQSVGVKWGPSWSDQPNVFFYLGNFSLFSLLLTLINKKQRQKEDIFYLSIVVLTILIALGSNLPGFALLQKFLPFLKFGRGPSMILLLTNLIMVVWFCSVIKRIKIEDKLLKFFSFIWFFILSFALIWLYFVYFDFNTLWQAINNLVGGRLESSVFHTLERDLVISKMIATNFLTAGIFSLLSVWAFKQKKQLLLIFVLAADVLIHTQGMFYFATQEIYDYKDMNFFAEKMQNHQYRSLIRNSNVPYTDFGTYWEAMTVRKPFSDSFIDDQELKSFKKLIHIRDAYTPNWNIINHVSIVNGYTTLLPKDYSLVWSKDGQTDINFISFINPNDKKLSDWAVKYYLVDYSFEVKEEIPFKELAREGNYVFYELPDTKARFRFTNDEEVNLINFSENPNQISFKFENVGNQQYLIVADRYDRNWQAWINEKEVIIENFNGMRRIEIVEGENTLLMRFIPKTFYWGLGISCISFFLVSLYFLLRR